LLALAPCAPLLVYYLMQVRTTPEPARRVVACVLAGAGAFGVAVLLQSVPLVRELSPVARALLIVGPLEEALKLLASVIAGSHPSRYTRLSTGLVYGVAAAVGFAAVENIAFVFRYGTATALLRALTAVPAHVLFSALIGLQLGRIHRAASAREAWRTVLFTYAAAAFAHGVYDALLTGPALFRSGVVVVLAVLGAAVALLFRQARAEDRVRDVTALRRVPMFNDAPIAALRYLTEYAVHRGVPARHVVVRQGRPGDAMFIVISGALAVTRDSAHLTTLTAGQFFGELTLLTGGVRNATVTTEQDSLLLRVGRRSFFDAVQRIDGFGEAVLNAANAREEQANLPGQQALDRMASSNAKITPLSEGVTFLAEQLAAVDVLVAVPPEDLRDLASQGEVIRRGPGAKLVRQGRRNQGLWMLLSGQVDILIDGVEVRSLGDGDSFGEVSLLTGWEATATVVADTPIEALRLEWEAVNTFIGRHPAVARQILGRLMARDAKSLQLGSLGDSVHRILQGPSADDPVVRALCEALPDLKTMPTSTAVGLAAHIRPVETAAGPGVWIGENGEIVGLRDVLGDPMGDDPIERPRWFLPENELDDLFAQAPELMRLLARVLIRSTA